jgi:hypothetical protein
MLEGRGNLIAGVSVTAVDVLTLLYRMGRGKIRKASIEFVVRPARVWFAFAGRKC